MDFVVSRRVVVYQFTDRIGKAITELKFWSEKKHQQASRMTSFVFPFLLCLLFANVGFLGGKKLNCACTSIGAGRVIEGKRTNFLMKFFIYK